MRMDEILDKAAKKGIAIEVNGAPERLDLASENVRKALQRNLKLVVSTDAHSVGELQRHLPFGVAAARRGWARRADVLNTRDVEAFKEGLARR
jgi:DNA polymerase (family 10)